MRSGRSWFLVVAAMTMAWANGGCVRYAWTSAAESYRPPDEIAADVAEAGDRPVVLLITGSTIVAEFFDVMRDRLRERGLHAVIYQPPDLFTRSLRDGAERVGKAVEAAVEANGGQPIHVIAECNGGIVTRFYLEKLGGHPNVDRFISFVSAHNGTTGFPITYFPTLAEIEPGSDLMRQLAASSLPDDATTTVVSIFVCGDEVMKPHTTSALPGAINIEICDDEFAKRARKRKPHRVDHALGQAMIPMYRQHFACFWDEVAFELFVSALTDDPDTIRAFDQLEIKLHDRD
jgi:hypothetical protein